MNLKYYLLLHITLVIALCLLATVAYSLYQNDQQLQQQTRKIADALDKQLELQLLRIDAGFQGPEHFPDLDLWKETHSVSGICINILTANNNRTYRLCQGTELFNHSWPNLFEKIYRWVFDPGHEETRMITFKNQDYGSIDISPSVEKELAHAWENILALMKLSAFTLLAICLLVYGAISRALRPAQTIVSGLEKMRKGDLSSRLPNFEIIEWQRTGTAINQLVSNQQQLLCEHKKLTLKLITIQEEERLYLARELHDELSQCLATISAVAASITQTAKQQCPTLVPEIENISRINQRIMNTVRTLLVRLRPTEVDELGLETSLNDLINEWHLQTGEKTHIRLEIQGEIKHLSKPMPVTLYRIVQECLTNVAKHSTATNVLISLKITTDSILLKIEDDGSINKLPFTDNQGIGLLGIGERVAALDGQLTLEIGKSGGITVIVKLPTQRLLGEPISL